MRILREQKLIIFLIILFIIVRIIAFLGGMQMVGVELLNQNISFVLLKESLFESLFYDHYQPPFVNLFLGLVIKITNQYKTFFEALHFLMSIVIICQLFFILKFIGLSKTAAFISTTLFILNPAFLYFEKWVFYHHVVILLFSNATYFLCKYSTSKKIAYLFIFYASLCCVAMFRSSFLWVYFLIVAAILIAIDKQFKRHIIAAAFPFLIIISVNIKNLVLFDFFGSSSISNSTLWLVARFVDPKEIANEYNDGKISTEFLLGSWGGDINSYKSYLAPRDTIISDELKKIPLLTNYKNDDFFNNRNYHFLQASKYFGKDARYLILQHPKAIINCSLWGAYVYFQPTSDYGTPYKVDFLRKWNKIYNTVIMGQITNGSIEGIPIPQIPNAMYEIVPMLKSMDLKKISFFTFLLYLAVFTFLIGLILNFSSAKHDNKSLSVILFCGFSLLYIFVIYTSMTAFENNRLRSEALIFEWVLFSLIVQRSIAPVRKYFLNKTLSRFPSTQVIEV